MGQWGLERTQHTIMVVRRLRLPGFLRLKIKITMMIIMLGESTAGVIKSRTSPLRTMATTVFMSETRESITKKLEAIVTVAMAATLDKVIELAMAKALGTATTPDTERHTITHTTHTTMSTSTIRPA